MGSPHAPAPPTPQDKANAVGTVMQQQTQDLLKLGNQFTHNQQIRENTRTQNQESRQDNRTKNIESLQDNKTDNQMKEHPVNFVAAGG
jgi:hypothetical protein